MLAYNVAGLLASAPGADRRYEVSSETLELPDDLRLAVPLSGKVHLRRTDRSVLVDAALRTGLVERCSRCLREMVSPIEITLSEEALPTIDFASGLPVNADAEPDALRIDEHHEIDLGPPVADAISMAEPIAPLCRADCAGLCTECGADLNEEPGHRHAEAAVDPRLALLGDWRPTKIDT
jgi:uncharacterized protein